jgi:hypothetical protein
VYPVGLLIALDDAVVTDTPREYHEGDDTA